MTTWVATLDAFEARLESQRAALDAGTAGTVAPFTPPSGLGSLPASLAGRADDLLQQALDLEQELSDNVSALALDLAVVRRVEGSTAAPTHARFVDFTA